MNLQPVTVPPHFRYTCFKCAKRLPTEDFPLIADLHGPPFEAYYCPTCATSLTPVPLGASNAPA